VEGEGKVEFIISKRGGMINKNLRRDI